MATTDTTSDAERAERLQAWVAWMNERQPEWERVFARIRNPHDWKEPINWVGRMTTADAVLAIEAVEHFTATKASIRYLSDPAGPDGEATVQILADGYRRGPAN